MMNGMDLEEGLLQMETTLLDSGKKEWEMAGVDMFIIQNQIKNRLQIQIKKFKLLLKKVNGLMMNLLDSNKLSL